MSARRRHSWAAVVAILTGAVASSAAAQQQLPTPASVIGFEPCADRKLATYEQILAYFRTLDAASDRMDLVDIGPTAEGRSQVMALISSEANLRARARYQSIAQRLALVRDLTDEQANALAAEGKAVVWIDFGLHSTEVAHAQAAALMAHKAVSEDSAAMRSIRDNVIFLLVPNMNPDGTTLVADWYMKYAGTAYERTSPPELYQKHAGHDNNRDWFMFNLPESRNIARQLYEEWFPQIVYNQHQAAPFPARIFVPPFDDPMNPNIPPLVMRGINLLGDAITRRLEQEGKTGAISRLTFDTWWNGGMRTAPYFHNMIGILTETAHSSATPTTNDPNTFPATFEDGRPTLEPSTYYPSPYRGGEWHLRDSCDYMVTTSMAVLDLGAKRRVEWLSDIYRMGRKAIADGAGELVALDSASELPLVVFGLPVRDVTLNHRESDFYVPGTLVKLMIDSTHPVGFGMPDRAAAFLAQSPAFEIDTHTGAPSGTSAGRLARVAWYPERDLLLSGWLLGGDVLASRAAVVEARVGKGRVVLLGLRAQHRGQSHGTFKLLFNTLYLRSAP